MRRLPIPTATLLGMTLALAPAPAVAAAVADKLVAALGDDGVPLNATNAFGEILAMRREGMARPELIEALERALDSTDAQQRQLAAVSLLYLYNDGRDRAWPPELVERAVEALRSDRIAFNALWVLGAVHHFAFEDPGRLPEALVSGLASALAADDLQQRQLAAALLAKIFESQARPEAEWPERLIPTLLEGLNHDDIRGGRQVGNLSESFRALYGLETRRPVDRLWALQREGDPQASWAATLILSRYLAGTVEPELTAVLVANLADDDVVFNEVAAFKALRQLGEGNLRSLLERLDRGAGGMDTQQAAFVQCLAAWFGIEWRPPAEALESWLAAARERQRIATAALFLTPDRDAFLGGRAAPEPLARMIRLGPPAREPRALSRWAAGWIWWLSTDQEAEWLGVVGLWPVSLWY